MHRTGISILNIILPFLLFHSYPGFPVEKNDYVVYEVKEDLGNYRVTYRFKDHFNNFQTYSLSLPVDETERMCGKFGVPSWLFEPYVDNGINRKIREEEIANGLFRLDGNLIEVDKNAVLAYYSEPFLRPIAEMIVSSLADYGADNHRNRTEFAMRFVQDIPYGVPVSKEDGRHLGGVYVPPRLLISGYGDCDSKALLFAGIMIYLVPADDILFLNQPDHVLTAIREEPGEGSTFVRFKGDKFLIAETAGPGLRLLGQKGNYYRDQFMVEELRIDPPAVLPYSKNSSPMASRKQALKVESNVLMLQNISAQAFQFQISSDKRHWESMRLQANQAGKYVFDYKTRVYLRFSSGRDKTYTYELGTGYSYTISWNSRKKRWEVTI